MDRYLCTFQEYPVTEKTTWVLTANRDRPTTSLPHRQTGNHHTTLEEATVVKIRAFAKR